MEPLFTPDENDVDIVRDGVDEDNESRERNRVIFRKISRTWIHQMD